MADPKVLNTVAVVSQPTRPSPTTSRRTTRWRRCRC